ncbi:MAG: radical SAM protein [Firmicutes bacterium]|nr:radical SAM protein [Bacillota bacterium]
MSLGLHLVTLEITGRCNLSCSHCYRGSELPEDFSDFNLLLGYLAKVKPHFITVSGGEPLVLENIFELAKELKKVCRKLLLTTNGTLVREFPREYFKIFDEVQISLDGDESTHDKIRGRGVFEKAVSAACYLKEIVPVSFLCTVNADNHHKLDAFVQIAKENGAVAKIARMCGFGKNNLAPLTDPSIWKDVLLKAFHAGLPNDDPLNFWFNEKKKKSVKPNKIAGGCTAGIAGVAISPEMDVYPCVKLRIPAGNLKNQSLREIWLNSPLFITLRNWHNLKGKCSGCEYISICRGCRADAWARSKDYLAADPLCWLEGGGR